MSVEFSAEQVNFLVTKGVRSITPADALDFRPDDAYDAFKELRWGWSEGKATCAHCGHERVYEFQQRGLFKCAKCGKQFTVTVKTPFHRQKVGHKAIVGALAFKVHEPVTIMELADKIEVNYRSAWRLNKILRLFRSNLRAAKPQAAAWPYRESAATPRQGDGTDIIAAVHAAMPRQIPEHLRADVAQELILGVLTGELTVAQVGEQAQQYLKRFRKDYDWNLRDLSFDQPVPGTSDLSWGESI